MMSSTALRQEFFLQNRNHFCGSSAHNQISDESEVHFCRSDNNRNELKAFRIPS
jgi:hypothetical protein